MTTIEVNALTILIRSLPEIAKQLTRIADTLESNEERESEIILMEKKNDERR